MTDSPLARKKGRAARRPSRALVGHRHPAPTSACSRLPRESVAADMPRRRRHSDPFDDDDDDSLPDCAAPSGRSKKEEKPVRSPGPRNTAREAWLHASNAQRGHHTTASSPARQRCMPPLSPVGTGRAAHESDHVYPAILHPPLTHRAMPSPAHRWPVRCFES